jgi:hypothetical protein
MTSDNNKSKSKTELEYLIEVNEAMQLLKRNSATSQSRRKKQAIVNKTRSEKLVKYYDSNVAARVAISKRIRRLWDNPDWRKRMMEFRSSKEYKDRHKEGLKAARERKKKKKELK